MNHLSLHHLRCLELAFCLLLFLNSKFLHPWLVGLELDLVITTTAKLDRLIRLVCGRSLAAVLAIKVGLNTVGAGGGGNFGERTGKKDSRRERLR